MESKLKACCANCTHKRPNGHNGYCSQNMGIAYDNRHCSSYQGDGITPEQEIEELKNKLVAQCAVMGNPTPQFTADEIEAIRKIAQFMGVTVADSIIAKCDAMLKGVQG